MTDLFGNPDPVKEPKGLTAKCEAIYELYPRKTGKRAALEAIRRAIHRDGFQKVEHGTILFAEAVRPLAGTEHWGLVPYPSTFYHQGRYGDPAGQSAAEQKVLELRKANRPTVIPGQPGAWERPYHWWNYKLVESQRAALRAKHWGGSEPTEAQVAELYRALGGR